MNYKWQKDINFSVCSFHFSCEQDQSLSLSFGSILSLGHERVQLHLFNVYFVLSCDAVCCSAPDQAQLIQMVVWMLQRRLLIQLHTYVCLLVPPSEDEPGLRDEDPPLAARVGGRSLSTPSALSFGSPSMSSLSSLLCSTLRGIPG